MLCVHLQLMADEENFLTCVTPRVPLAVLFTAVKGAVYWKVHPVGHLHLDVSQVSVGVRNRLNPVPARTIKLFALGNLKECTNFNQFLVNNPDHFLLVPLSEISFSLLAH
jgi:hypothetical protein